MVFQLIPHSLLFGILPVDLKTDGNGKTSAPCLVLRKVNSQIIEPP
jgi:hypothetical protein